MSQTYRYDQHPVGGIEDGVPEGDGVYEHRPQPYQDAPNEKSKSKTFTFTRRTIIIIVVVAILLIGGLVGGLVGGLRSRDGGSDNSGSNGSSPAETSPAGTSGASTTGGTSSTTSTTSDDIISKPTGAPTGSISDPNLDADDPYPTSATFTVIGGGNGVTGISPTPFPGYEDRISSNALLKNGDFSDGTLDGWENEDGCWRALQDPSSSTPLQKNTRGNDWIARNNADDLSGGKSCNLTQIVRGAGPGTFELSFLWGNYATDDDTWFYTSAGSTDRPILLLAMQTTPGFTRYIEWQRAAYSIESEGEDFIVTFSAHSNVTSNDLSQVQLIKK